MSAFYSYDPRSPDSYTSQWSRYLQQKSVIQDLEHTMQDQTDQIRDSLGIVASTLQDGFYQITECLNQLNWGLTMVIERQRITNILAENIALLLRIPDAQKKRQYYLEQGLKFLKNATLDPDLYQDALEKLMEAEKLEKTDYFVLHRIGLIYLYSSEHLDVSKAEEYFRRAAKYSVVESDPQAVRIANILIGDIRGQFRNQTTPAEIIKLMAAESFLHTGIACYVQGKFEEAAELAAKAFLLAPEMLIAGFARAKSLAAGGHDKESATVVRDLVTRDRNYSIAAALDDDLRSCQAVREMLHQLRDEALNRISQILKDYKAKMIRGSLATPVLAEIEQLIKRGTYLDSMKAMDEMAKRRIWRINVIPPRFVEKLTMKDFGGDVLDVAFSPDGTLLAISDIHGKVYIKGLDQNQLSMNRDLGFENRIMSLKTPSHNKILAGLSENNHIIIWDLKTMSEIATLSGNRSHISCFDISRDGNIVIAGYNDGSMILWDINKKDQVFNSKGHNNSVSTLELNWDCTLLASCEAGEVHLRRVETMEPINNFCLESGKHFHTVTFNPDGSKLACGSVNEIAILDTVTGKTLSRITANKAPHYLSCFSPDGEYLVCTQGDWSDPEITIINVINGKSVAKLKRFEGKVKCVKFSPNGLLLACVTDKRIVLWIRQSGDVSAKPIEIECSHSVEKFIDYEKESLAGLELHKKTKVAARQKEIERKKGMEEQRSLLEKEKKIKNLLELASQAEKYQNKKWFGKNFSKTLELYLEAAKLGSDEAKVAVNRLGSKMKK
jgi:WD40 repeat protein